MTCGSRPRARSDERQHLSRLIVFEPSAEAGPPDGPHPSHKAASGDDRIPRIAGTSVAIVTTGDHDDGNGEEGRGSCGARRGVLGA